MGIWYCTRETVKSALDVKLTARMNAQIDRAIDSGASDVEGLLHRKFYPWTGTKYFNWPPRDRGNSYRLWFDQHDLISVTSFTSGGIALTTDEYFLEPVNDGPPYTHAEINLARASSFNIGDTWQRNIAIAGVWGFNLDEDPAGSLDGAINDTVTTLVCSDASLIGVGDLLRIGTERLRVIERQANDSGQNIGADLEVNKNDQAVSVTTGSEYHAGELLLVDSERMRVLDVAGNTLNVERGADGSTLAVHTTGADIYVYRTLTVTRGELGTTAASHSDTTAIARHRPPQLVSALNLGYAVNQLEQELSAYARTVGSGDNEREAGGRGIKQLEKDARRRYGRQARMRAV